MEANEIRNMYEVLSTEPAAYANSLAQRAGAAQASLGTLADAVRGASQTAGLGNYTYNRTIRPTVDTLRSSMVAQGMNQWANKLLSDAIQGAQRNYGNAARSYANNVNTPSTTPGSTYTFSEEETDDKRTINSAQELLERIDKEAVKKNDKAKKQAQQKEAWIKEMNRGFEAARRNATINRKK